MRYFGSKGSTVDLLYQIIRERVPSGTFCDPFGGVGIVGSYFKSKGYIVYTGDILKFSHYFQIARVQINRFPSFRNVCREHNLNSSHQIANFLNGLKPSDGWFVEEYAKKRGFFTLENAMRIEGCRRIINDWVNNKIVSRIEMAILVASLINSMDKVANTAGTYYSYLKQWYRKSLKDFSFEFIQNTDGSPNCRSFFCDAKRLVSKKSYDILYLDPPYNERSYADYYHLPETLANFDTPQTHGVSGIPVKRHSPKSAFNKKELAYNELKRILELAHFNLLIFHYADDGIIPSEDIEEILPDYGRVEKIYIDSKGYTTEKIKRLKKHCIYMVSHG
jgi:adenine-specific DNA-methyltransferase